jgi:sec-independent protein translocase protein TatC
VVEERNLTIIEHLTELRDRLIRSTIALAICFVISWFFRRDILYVLKMPLLEALPPEMRHTILLKVIDKFFIDLKVAFIGALFLAAPYIVFQIWRFIAPGLYSHEKRLALPIMLAGGFCFALGVLFCYFLVLPMGFEFLVGYSIGPVSDGGIGNPMLTDRLEIALREHIGLTASILFAFGMAFETPLFMFALGVMGIVPPEWFGKKRKYALIFIFIIAAALTPPDPWTQVALGIPMFILYELGIRATQFYLFVRKKGKPDTA